MSPNCWILSVLVGRLEPVMYVTSVRPNVPNRFKARERDFTNDTRSGTEYLALPQVMCRPAQFRLGERGSLVPISFSDVG